MLKFEVFMNSKPRYACIEADNDQEAKEIAATGVKASDFETFSLQCDKCKKCLGSRSALSAHERKCGKTQTEGEITHDSILKDLAKHLRSKFTVKCSLVDEQIYIFGGHQKRQQIAYVDYKDRAISIQSSYYAIQDPVEKKINVADPDYIDQAIKIITHIEEIWKKLRQERGW